MTRRNPAWQAPAQHGAEKVVYALGSLITIIGVTFALPWGLVLVAGSPLPRDLPEWDELVMGLSRPDDGTLLLAALKYVTWIAWAVFVLLLLTEAIARLGRKRTPRIPGLRGPQQLAALLLTGIGAFIVGASMSYDRTAALPPVAPAAAVAAGPTHLANGHGDQATQTSTAHRQQPTVVTVKPGESLSTIARDHLPDGASNARIAELVTSIYDENEGLRQTDGTRLKDRDLIHPGWKLRIPPVAEKHKPPEQTKPHRPDRHKHQPERPSHQPTPSKTPTTGQRTSPPHPSPASRQPHVSPGTQRPAVGVDLPSGSVVAASLAAVISAAILVGRRRRSVRHRCAHTPGTTPPEQPPPDTARRMRRAHLAGGAHHGRGGGEHAGGADDHRPASVPPQGGLSAATSSAEDSDARAVPSRPDLSGSPSAPPVSPALGVIPLGIDDANRNEVAVDLAVSAGIGISGPAADRVARHAAVTVLAAAGADPGEVILAGPEATALLPAATEAPGLTRFGSVEEALGRIETEIVHRRRLADEATDLAGLRDAQPDQPLPLILLITDVPNDATRRRLETVLSLGRHLGIAGVLLGVWAHGSTCTVTSGGHITSVTGQGLEPLEGTRACTLATSDAVDLLTAIAGSRARTAESGSAPTIDPPAAPRPPAQSSPVARLCVLGPVRLLDASQEGGREIGVERRSARELAVYLAAHPGGASVDAITEAIWPDYDPVKVVQRRKDAFKTLRQALREATGTSTDLIRRTGDGHYQLRADLVDVDLWRFHGALADAAQAANDDELQTALTRASDAYTGDLAADAAYEWIEPIRETERRHAIDTLTRLAELEEQTNPGTALANLENAFTLDPYAEEVARRIMAIQLKTGQLDAARRTYQLLETRLAEIGIEPTEETEQYLRGIGERRDGRRGT